MRDVCYPSGLPELSPLTFERWLVHDIEIVQSSMSNKGSFCFAIRVHGYLPVSTVKSIVEKTDHPESDSRISLMSDRG